MSNNYYNVGDAIQPFTTAKSQDIIAEYQAIQAAFAKLPEADQLVANAETIAALLAGWPNPASAALVGSDDGTGGTLWSTIAGFITYLKSSAGASVMGFLAAGAGAVARTMQSKGRDTVSVTDFGANGVDDTAAFAAAQTAHKTLQVPAGVYPVDPATLLTSKFRGPGIVSRAGKLYNAHDTEGGFHGGHADLAQIGNMATFQTALANKVAKVAIWGDSIAEGLSQIASEDAWPRLLKDAMEVRAPGTAFTFGNFSISGRGVGEANSGTYVGTAGAVTPGTNFNQVAGGAGAIPDFTLWPGGTTPGNTWHQHVQAFAPDLLIIPLSINNTTDPHAVAANLRSLINNRISLWTKIPSIILVTPTMPTRLDVTRLAQQPYIEGNGHAIRALSKELGASLVDMNRLWIMLRDGVDVARQRFACHSGVAGYSVLGSGTAPTITGSMTFSGSGIVFRPFLHRDIIARADFALSGTMVGSVWYRWNSANKAYVVQIQRGAPQVVLYYNGVSLGAGAIAAGTNYRVYIEAIGSRHRVWVSVDGGAWVNSIDVYDSQSFTQGYIEGFSGIEGTAGVVASNLSFRLGYPRQIGPQVMGDELLLGDPALAPNGDYTTNATSLGGNSINHPTILGHYHACFAAFAGFLNWLAANASPAWPKAVLAPPVSETATAPVASDYLDISVNGSAASAGSEMVGTGLNAELDGEFIVNVTNAATPIEVRLMKNGAQFLLNSFTVPSVGRWLVRGCGHVSANGVTYRNGLSASAIRVA